MENQRNYGESLATYSDFRLRYYYQQALFFGEPFMPSFTALGNCSSSLIMSAKIIDTNSEDTIAEMNPIYGGSQLLADVIAIAIAARLIKRQHNSTVIYSNNSDSLDCIYYHSLKKLFLLTKKDTGAYQVLKYLYSFIKYGLSDIVLLEWLPLWGDIPGISGSHK